MSIASLIYIFLRTSGTRKKTLLVHEVPYLLFRCYGCGKFLCHSMPGWLNLWLRDKPVSGIKDKVRSVKTIGTFYARKCTFQQHDVSDRDRAWGERVHQLSSTEARPCVEHVVVGLSMEE